ncbi:MAG: pyruvate kinase [Erysipelotrichaceae bacterium]|nr:pyruvate kinase [Erysipelotrichaceae bacterium]MBQ1322788.1 pyruvate kinase [Erysipelotrichaceae bacterium]MBQ1379875.1 pyruvate kinase [Erysipelotrichaceae bacterium]MBQ1624603.1 pyruvate kinase [Erysipelotrichaceae bacterium]MBQ1740986.1 pyruvate kinase [Erysipelotrichaceae bacterium]
MKKTKIVCTIGPSSNNEEMLRKMIAAGMNVARFNFSHGSHETQKANLDLVKKVREEMGAAVATMMDTKGPEIRFRDFENGKISLEKGQDFILSTDDFVGDSHRGSITYAGLPGDVHVGSMILVNDGLIQLQVTDITQKEITTKVIVPGDILNHKGLNAPGAELKMPFISEQDRKDILFGIEQDYDYIALSFVRTAKDVEAVRAILDFSGSKMKIIAKIESTQGVENLEEILAAADGLMVARGDMGVELPPEQVPYIQKKMIDMANAAGKITICATQMLESMTHNPRPTRAEVGDVANAVYDGATAVMLSGESAAGDYPLESVEMMSKIAEESEKHLHNVYHAVDDSQRSIVGKAACDLADTLGVEKIIVYTDTGRSPAVVSQIKPKTPIIVMTRNEKVYYQSALLYGVEPVRIADIIEDENLEAKTREYMEKVNIKSAILLFGHAIDSIKVLNR